MSAYYLCREKRYSGKSSIPLHAAMRGATKILAACAAALVAGIASAKVSSEVVGYYDAPVEKGKFSLIAINLNPMTENQQISIQDLFPADAPGMTKGMTAARADQIQVWDSEQQKYRNFFLYTSKRPTDKKKNKWVEKIGSKPVAEIMLKSGDAVFFYPQNPNLHSLKIAGEAPFESKGTIKQGFNLIGAGFPASWCPNDAGTNFWANGNFTRATKLDEADQIQVWDRSTQTYRNFFLYAGESQDDTKKDKWVESTDEKKVMDTSIDLSNGFFYYKRGAGEVDFKPPLPYSE